MRDDSNLCLCFFPLPMWTSSAADDLSVVGSLIRIALRPLVNSSPLYSRLSSGERTMSLTTLFTAGSLILESPNLSKQDMIIVSTLHYMHYRMASKFSETLSSFFLTQLSISMPWKHESKRGIVIIFCKWHAQSQLHQYRHFLDKLLYGITPVTCENTAGWMNCAHITT